MPVENVVHSLERERLERQDGGHGVGRQKDALVPEHDRGLRRGIVDELHGRLEHRDEGALAPDEQPREIETPVLVRQEPVEVVAGDAATELRVARANLRSVTIAELPEPGEQHATGVAHGDRRRELGLGHPADVEDRPVVQKHLERLDVVHRDAVDLRVHTTAIVRQHSAEAAPAVGRRLRPPT